MNELEIFTAALELADAAARDKYLDEVCGDCAERRARLEALIRNAAQASRYLESPPTKMQATLDELITERVGTQIGPYKLLEQIGEGGMGVVYMAQQSEPVKRRVALKLIKPGMDTRQVIARFEAERQALALMDHMNIARVLDAGATETGGPYFVMELVHGVPITKYCDEQHLTPRERLELFVPVCQAIEHAHQKGIIHRDIKPSNVMITLYDGKPVPKVIDFGVAKAMDQKLTERTLFTQYGAMVGTLEYMSPEQAEMSALGTDTRSDIYSLGVLLYELLTGSTPLTRQRVRDAAYDEILRVIREEEPPKPSTRLNDSGDTLATISSQRQTDPAKLMKLIRGELDWIVMKALEKDRSRRYETATSLADDIRRYLNDEAVQACPPSPRYRFRKFASRNKAALSTATLVAAALLLGAVVSVWQAWEANRAHKLADEKRSEAQKNFESAVEAVDKMLVEVSEQLRDVPQAEKVRRTLLSEAIKFYVRFLEEHSDDPRVRYQTAMAYRKIASIQRTLAQNGLADAALVKSIDILQELVGSAAAEERTRYEHDLAGCYQFRGILLRDAGRLKEAEPVLRQAVAISRTVGDKEWIAGRLNDLGLILAHQGRIDEAESANNEALAIREQIGSSVLFESYWNQCCYFFESGRYSEAAQSCRKILQNQERRVARAPESQRERIHLASAYLNLALVLTTIGQFSEAEVFARKAVTNREKLAADFPNTPDRRASLAESQHALASVLMGTGQVSEAEEYLRKAIAIAEQLVAEFPTTPNYRLELGNSHHDLGKLLMRSGQLPDAVKAYEQAQNILEKLATEDPVDATSRCSAAGNLSSLGAALADAGRLGHADTAVLKSLTSAEKVAAEFPKMTVAQTALADAHAGLGRVRYRSGNLIAAVAPFKKRLELSHQAEPSFEVQENDTLARFFLAMACWQLKEKDEARKWYDQAVEWMDKNQPRNEELRRVRTEAAELLELTGEPKSQHQLPAKTQGD